ncbi:MAG: ABC transporter ATP-binding protein [Elusimicrobiota bacterium]|nr:ABC transporter ATP-binding protein [Elusimicrobiota bacterium]
MRKTERAKNSFSHRRQEWIASGTFGKITYPMKKICFKSVNKIFTPNLEFKDLLSLNIQKPSYVKALDNISFDITEGSLIGVLGENGAGKTTLLKLLSGLLTPDSGEISIFEKNPLENSLEIKNRTGLLLNQDRSFYWRLTAKENINFFANMYGLDKKTVQKRLERLFEILGINETIYKKRFDSLSSGMMKKFSIIRALLHNPDIVLLDEPTKNLDYESSKKFNAFARDYLVKKQGRIIFYVSHDISELEAISDKIMILKKGKLLKFSNISDLRAPNENSLADIFMKMVARHE